MRRISIPIEDDLFETLRTLIPDRVRSETYRCLFRMMLRCQETNMNTYVVDDILNERLVLARRQDIKPEILEVYDGKATA